MLQPWQKGIITKVVQIAPNTNVYTIKLEEQNIFDFKAGQFITFDLPIHEKTSKRLRSYSIASAPNNGNEIDLVIVLANPSTGGSQYIFDNFIEGLEVTLRGPQGVFVLNETKASNVYFICTGTGIAPFRSMLFNVLKQGNNTTNYNLIFGCRTKADLLFFNEMNALAAKYANFKYYPTCSRETWEGLTGYVHPVYEKLIQEENFAKTDAQFYLCGWRTMIDDTKHKLIDLGIDKSQIHYELYG